MLKQYVCSCQVLRVLSCFDTEFHLLGILRWDLCDWDTKLLPLLVWYVVNVLTLMVVQLLLLVLIVEVWLLARNQASLKCKFYWTSELLFINGSICFSIYSLKGHKGLITQCYFMKSQNILITRWVMTNISTMHAVVLTLSL